jgi:glyoxylase-like metal-dependent hydrolase (beta-lactamase superfamily II)
MNIRFRAAIAGISLLGSVLPLAAQTAMDSVKIQTIPAGPGVYMLLGSGGNIALAVGDDFAFLVDDQFAPLSGRILDAVHAVTTKPIRFLLNTHWHSDHTGGNENMANTGIVIVAHDNVRTRMGTDQFIALFNSKTPASPKAALPIVTFSESASFFVGGESIHAVHVPPAHTDGDLIVHFTRANTIHMGDLFFNGRYPFVDLSSGGSFEGVIRAVNATMAYVNDSTKVIPGHGPLAGKKELVEYRDVLVAIRDRVATLIKKGKTKEEVIAAKPSAEWDASWGTGFMKPEVFLGVVYDSMKKQ